MPGSDRATEPKSAENTRVAREVTGALVATGRAPLRRCRSCLQWRGDAAGPRFQLLSQAGRPGRGAEGGRGLPGAQ